MSGHIFQHSGGNLTLQNHNGQQHKVSNRFGWSVHNCQHGGPKTGLVLYPANSNYKNIVLLVCERHYGYQKGLDSQHEQLHKWYFSLYGESKQFPVVSGFALKADGTLGFNSLTFNAKGPYTDHQKEMGVLEQNIVRVVVEGKLDSYKLP